MKKPKTEVKPSPNKGGTTSNKSSEVVPREFEFHGSTMKDMRELLPTRHRDTFATALEAVQYNKPLELSSRQLKLPKGKTAVELRINGRPAYRVVYSLDRPGKVDILYVGKKTAQRTCNKLMNTVKERLARL